MRRRAVELFSLVRRSANGAVRLVLRSRLHPLLSSWLLLLGYRGRRTGRRYTIPLLYVRDGDDLLLVALHPRGQSWWRNLRDGADVDVLLAGDVSRAHAALVADRAAAHARYVAARPWTRPLLDRSHDPLFVRLSPHRGPDSPGRSAGLRLPRRPSG